MESYTKHLFPILIDTRSTVTKRVTILKLNQLWHGRNLSPGTEKTQMEYTKRASTKKMLLCFMVNCYDYSLEVECSDSDDSDYGVD